MKITILSFVLLGCSFNSIPMDFGIFATTDNYKLVKVELEVYIESDTEEIDFTVEDLKTGEKKDLKSCVDFYDAHKKKMHFMGHNADRKVYSYNGLMCFVARELYEGRLSKKSYLKKVQVDKNIMDYLPGAMMYDNYVSSTKVSDEVKNGSWAKAEKLKLIEKREREVIYESYAMKHYISVEGRGDFNGDGVEDALIMVRNFYIGGSGFDEMLYVVTRHRDDEVLKIIKIYTATRFDI